MKKTMLSLTLALFSTTLIASSASTEPHPGKILHENHCLSCHTDKPYNPSKTDSFPKLLKSIRFCNDNVGIGLFDDEIDDIADYLNKTYYQHDK